MRQLLADAQAALRDGRWDAAQTMFTEAVRADPAAEAMDGLGAALWWLGEPDQSLAWRRRAYAAYRRGGATGPAVLAAIGIAVTYQANFANHAVAAGWAARAWRLAEACEPEPGPLTGWVQVVQAYLCTDADTAADLAQHALRLARRVGDVDLELCGLTGLGLARVAAGATDDGMTLIDEAMAAVHAGEYRTLDTVVYTGCDMLVACDLAADLRRAAQWCRVTDQFVDRYGCPFLYARCRALYGSVLVATGHWGQAEHELNQAIRMADRAGPAQRAEALARLADLRVRQGRLTDAEALLDGCPPTRSVTRVTAALRLATGDADMAVALLTHDLDRVPNGRADLAGPLSLLVEAQLARDRTQEARAAARRLAAVPATRLDGQAGAHAAHATGRLAGHTGRPTATRELTRAADLFTALDLPYEAAQSRLHLARLLATTDPTTATMHATATLHIATTLGARAMADAANAVLRELGVHVRMPPHRPDLGQLTEREHDVLDLLAQGLSNPQIAQRLYISRKTAAHHVSRILTKLGLHNRVQAAAYATARRQ